MLTKFLAVVLSCALFAWNGYFILLQQGRVAWRLGWVVVSSLLGDFLEMDLSFPVFSESLAEFVGDCEDFHYFCRNEDVSGI